MNAYPEDITRQTGTPVAVAEPAQTPGHDAHDTHGAAEIGSPVPYFIGVALLLAGWAASVAAFGLPGLFVPALIAVPIIFVGLIAISWG